MTRAHRRMVRLLACALVAATGFGLALGFSRARAGATATYPATVTGGQTLTSGSILQSPDGHYQATFSNGVLSDRFSGGRTLWSVGSSSAGSYAVLQPNGELVIFSSDGQVQWTSGKTGTGCPSLSMQLDGNLVDSDTSPIWASGSVQHGLEGGDVLLPGWSIYAPGYEYRLTMATNGDLILYNDSDTEIWKSETYDNPGAYASMQTDGNFVVYSSSSHVLWATNTSGHPGSVLSLSDHGDLGVNDGSTSEWSSKTDGDSGTGQPFVTAVGAASSTPCPAPAPPAPTVPATTVTTTQTVLVPTTTVVTVTAPSTTPAHRRQLNIKLELDWYYVGDSTTLHAISVGRLPRGTQLTSTFDPHQRGHRDLVRRASTSRSLGRLLSGLRTMRFHAGQTLNLNLTRRGYVHEWATFVFRDGALPRTRTAAPARRR